MHPVRVCCTLAEDLAGLLMRLLFVLVLLAGCSSPAITKTAPTISPLIHVFYQGEKPASELVFALRNTELYAETTLPTGEIKIYHCLQVPEPVLIKLRGWTQKQQTATRMEGGGQLKSNGPIAMTIHTVDYTPQRSHSWRNFVADDDFTQLMDAVKALLALPEHAATKPPDWMVDDDRVREDFATMKNKSSTVPP